MDIQNIFGVLGYNNYYSYIGLGLFDEGQLGVISDAYVKFDNTVIDLDWSYYTKTSFKQYCGPEL